MYRGYSGSADSSEVFEISAARTVEKFGLIDFLEVGGEYKITSVDDLDSEVVFLEAEDDLCEEYKMSSVVDEEDTQVGM